MPTLRIPLRIVFYRCDGNWIAHCLEFDLCGHGMTRAAAMSLLSEAIRVQVEDSVEHGNLRNLFTPADSEVFRMFCAGKDTVEGDLHLTFDHVVIERTELREYSETDAGFDVSVSA